jgi:hypothetical protein
VAQVDAHVLRLVAEFAQVDGERCAGVVPASGDNNAGTFLRESKRGGAANAGDENDAVIHGIAP